MITKRFDIKHTFPLGGDPVDFAALESLEEFKQVVSNASLILGVDVTGRGESLFYGKEIFRAVAWEVVPPQEMKCVVFAIDFETDQLEKLCAAVQVVKGMCEYGDGKNVK